MSAEKHTGGTWRAGNSLDSIVSDIVLEGLDDPNRVHYGGHLIAESVAPCNRPLLIAAPELLKSLQSITDHFASVMGGPLVAGAGVTFRGGVEGIPTIVAARAAIAKATGGAA